MTQPRPPWNRTQRLAAGCWAAAVLMFAVGILRGIQRGQLHTEPAVLGGLLMVVVSLTSGALSMAPPDSKDDTTYQTLAATSLVGLLVIGYLFGPLSLVIVAGIPLLGAVTARRMGVSFGQKILGAGLFAGLVLSVAYLFEVVPVAPAFVQSDLRELTPIILLQTGMLFLLTGLVSLFDLAPPEESGVRVIDTVVPPPPRRTTRTGSYSLNDLALLDPVEEPATDTIDERLELQKLESLGVLAGGVAHDFNNLLMSILGSTSVALTDLGPHDEMTGTLREIETAALRARDLVKQLLAYAGKGNVAPTPVDVNDLVREMTDLLQAAMHDRAPVQYELCAGTPVVMADPTQLRQVVMNLITNAGDAMRDKGGGSVRLHTELRTVEKEELDATLLGAACEAGAYVVVTCIDQGVGMDAETLSRIFDPFYTTKRTGRGLGLAAVLGIVRRCEGTMVVDSELGRGTRFRLYLPHAAEIDEEEDFATENTSSAKGWKTELDGIVLIIDDDPVVRMVAERMIRKLGLDVRAAENGMLGLDAFVEEREDILFVLLDMTMPGWSGLETLERIREIDAEVQVILTSGYSDQQIPTMAQCVFLQKPYSLKQLSRTLDHFRHGS